jgi:hypothetical protein
MDSTGCRKHFLLKYDLDPIGTEIPVRGDNGQMMHFSRGDNHPVTGITMNAWQRCRP